MKNGYFTPDSREYVIENMHPIRPLKNYLWNEGLIADLNHFGIGLSKACINKVFRPLIHDYRLVYVKDKKSGEFYDVNRNFKNLPFDIFRARVGLGYHTVESEYKGVFVSFKIAIPKQDFVENHEVIVKNVSNETKTLSLYTYIVPHINISEHQAYTKTKFSEEMQGLYYAHRPARNKEKFTDFYYTASEKAVAFALSKDTFHGVYGSVENPESLLQDKLPCILPVFEPYYAGALQFDLTLKAGEQKRIILSAGIGQNYDDCLRLAKKYSNEKAFDSELEDIKNLHEQYIATAEIQTPDGYLDTMATVWLKRQMSLGKTWGRVYGKGFRDVLQDITGFVSLDKPLARERLLYTLKHQFVNGNAIRMFDPILDHPYQDMPAWIAPAVLAYLKESGDLSILDEQVGYYDGEDVDSVFDHVKRGMNFLFNSQGEHGLSLWGGGDWNDSMDGVGLNMKGESVWLSIATVNCSADYIEIIKLYNPKNANQLIQDATNKREKLKVAIRTHGMENGRFIYGINDWGEKIGSLESQEATVFLNPQTWAVMSDILTESEKQSVMDVVEKHLKCDYGYMMQNQPYTIPNEHIGRLTFFEAGVYENGSVYNHGVMFKVVADCFAGRGEKAWETLKINRYDNPLNANSGVEPYAVSNMYFGPSSPKKGYAPLSWITGSAGWMYRAIVEFILGVKPEFKGLKLAPCIPQSWNGAKIKRIFRDVTYEIEFIKYK